MMKRKLFQNDTIKITTYFQNLYTHKIITNKLTSIGYISATDEKIITPILKKFLYSAHNNQLEKKKIKERLIND